MTFRAPAHQFRFALTPPSLTLKFETGITFTADGSYVVDLKDWAILYGSSDQCVSKGRASGESNNACDEW
jgi:hypothetical protein